MRRREFIALIGASATWPFAALAQETGRTYRVGLLWAAPPESAVVIAFLDEVGRHGFVVGKNLTVDYRAFGLHPERLPEYAARTRWRGQAVIPRASALLLAILMGNDRTF
jgi:putative ABC transport system substrate-binding protein